jgi:hypothetical protein
LEQAAGTLRSEALRQSWMLVGGYIKILRFMAFVYSQSS